MKKTALIGSLGLASMLFSGCELTPEEEADLFWLGGMANAYNPKSTPNERAMGRIIGNYGAEKGRRINERKASREGRTQVNVNVNQGQGRQRQVRNENYFYEFRKLLKEAEEKNLITCVFDDRDNNGKFNLYKDKLIKSNIFYKDDRIHILRCHPKKSTTKLYIMDESTQKGLIVYDSKFDKNNEKEEVIGQYPISVETIAEAHIEHTKLIELEGTKKYDLLLYNLLNKDAPYAIKRIFINYDLKRSQVN